MKYTIYLPYEEFKSSCIGYDCSRLVLKDYLIKNVLKRHFINYEEKFITTKP